MNIPVYDYMLSVQKDRGAGFLVLLDPDAKSPDQLAELARTCALNGVDGILVGGSLIMSAEFDRVIEQIKGTLDVPLILFPGNGRQLSAHADAVLFLSLISGRNPYYLIGEQVLSAPIIKALQLEAISTGYMLIESGGMTSVEFMSNTRPIPREKPNIAVAHALAAEYLGMKMLYLEAGSGAALPVPDEMVHAVRRSTEMSIIVGGGITDPDVARQKVEAGASWIVTGTVFEDDDNHERIAQFARAIHFKK